MDVFKGLKGFAAEASTALSRAKQFTGERFGTSEKTELDGYFENLLTRADQTKIHTEKIVASAEALLQPNPSNRVEDYLMENLFANQRKERLRNLEWLGSDMVNAGTELSPGDVYGNALIRAGQTQLKVGQDERDFVAKAYMDFIRPLKFFLDNEVKALVRERRSLEVKRLDLDAAKSKYKKVRTNENPTNLTFDQIIRELQEAEHDLRNAQGEFDRQVALVTTICEKVISSNTEHVGYLKNFIRAQADYYRLANEHLTELLNEETAKSADSSQQNTSTDNS